MENIQLKLIYVIKKKTSPNLVQNVLKQQSAFLKYFQAFTGFLLLNENAAALGVFCLGYGNSSLGRGAGSRNSSGPHFCTSVSSPPSLPPSGSTRQDTVRTSRSPGLSTLTLRCAPYAGPSANARKRRPRGHKEFRQRSPGFAVCSSSASAQRQSQRCPVRVPLRSSNKLQMIFKPKTRHTHGSCLQSENPMAYHQRMDQSLD
nr:uncharacterized protein LOC116282821 isoform X2 [Vicugna pacos]